MDIKYFNLEKCTIEEFADKHGLTMEIHERRSIYCTDPNKKYYAYFSNSEIKEGGTLKGEYGNGINSQNAIKDYAERISEKLLVINAMDTDKRQEISVPVLVDG